LRATRAFSRNNPLTYRLFYFDQFCLPNLHASFDELPTERPERGGGCSKTWPHKQGYPVALSLERPVHLPDKRASASTDFRGLLTITIGGVRSIGGPYAPLLPMMLAWLWPICHPPIFHATVCEMFNMILHLSPVLNLAAATDRQGLRISRAISVALIAESESTGPRYF
jgi:hypothetical protein